MTVLRNAFVVALCALSLAACGKDNPLFGPSPFGTAIAGFVSTKDTGARLQNVKVTITSGPNAGKSAVTAFDGTYQINYLSPAVDVQVSFEKDGFEKIVQTVTVTKDQLTSLNAQMGFEKIPGTYESVIPATTLEPKAPGIAVPITVVPNRAGLIKFYVQVSDPSAWTIYYLYYDERRATECAAKPELDSVAVACPGNISTATRGSGFRDFNIQMPITTAWVVFKNWEGSAYVLSGTIRYVPAN